jgi:hypothetical protein
MQLALLMGQEEKDKALRGHAMFRAEILWLEKGPTLKMEGRLVGNWAGQARHLITKEVLQKWLVVELSEVNAVDSAGERFLSWLGSVGAVFTATGVYATAVCESLGLSLVRRIPAQRHGSKEETSSITLPVKVDAVRGRNQKEEE